LLVAAAAVAGTAAALPAAEAALPGAAGTKLELFRGVNAPGLSAADNESVGDPPDPTGSVSRLHYVEVVNARIAVYERERLRRPVADMDATAFWGADQSIVVDPQIAWDDRARRWYYVMLRNRPNANSIFFAWSKSADPSDLEGGWCTAGSASASGERAHGPDGRRPRARDSADPRHLRTLIGTRAFTGE
jgi:hypothetical protein